MSCLEQWKLQGKRDQKLENGLYFGENLEDWWELLLLLSYRRETTHIFTSINPLRGVQLVGKAWFSLCSIEPKGFFAPVAPFQASMKRENDPATGWLFTNHEPFGSSFEFWGLLLFITCQTKPF